MTETVTDVNQDYIPEGKEHLIRRKKRAEDGVKRDWIPDPPPLQTDGEGPPPEEPRGRRTARGSAE